MYLSPLESMSAQSKCVVIVFTGLILHLVSGVTKETSSEARIVRRRSDHAVIS